MKPMDEWTQGEVHTADGLTLRTYRSGGAQPPLLLVHGFTDNALYFSRTAEALGDQWDVIAYDVRGHGHSSRAQGDFEDASRVRDLLTVVDTLALDRPIMIGHSLGAATIALAVAARPGLSRGIVLEDPAWWELPDLSEAELDFVKGARLERNTKWRDSIASVQSMSGEEGLAWRRTDAPLWSDRDVELSLASRLQVELDLFTYYPQLESPWKQVVSSFDCPALLVLGSERDAIISVDQATEAHELNPLVQWAQVQGAGHSVRYDQFDDYLSAVQNFLATLS